MNPLFLRQKLSRVLSRPPEVLYALSSHPFLILGCLCLGGLATWASQVSMQTTYVASAQLLVQPPDTTAEGRVNARSRLEQFQFFNRQVRILDSDPVIGDMLKILTGEGTETGSIADSNPVQQIGERLNDFQDRIEELIKLDQAAMGARGNDLQARIYAFRDRARLEPDSKNNVVHLYVHGQNRDAIMKEIRTWIDSYEERANAIAQKGQEELIQSRLSYRREVRDEADRKLKKHLETYPEIADWTAEDLMLVITNTQARIQELDNRILNYRPETPADRPRSPALLELEGEIQGLERTLRGREMALFDMELYLAPDTPEIGREKKAIGHLKSQIEAKQKEIARIEAAENVPTTTASGRDVLAELRGQRQEKALEFTRLVRLKKHVHTLADLEKTLEVAQGDLQEVEATANMVATQRGVDILEPQRPAVNARREGPRPLYVVLGGIGIGMFVGMALAVLCEVFSGRVRFKHDVMAELGMPVIAVFPK